MPRRAGRPVVQPGGLADVRPWSSAAQGPLLPDHRRHGAGCATQGSSPSVTGGACSPAATALHATAPVTQMDWRAAATPSPPRSAPSTVVKRSRWASRRTGPVLHHATSQRVCRVPPLRCRRDDNATRRTKGHAPTPGHRHRSRRRHHAVRRSSPGEGPGSDGPYPGCSEAGRDRTERPVAAAAADGHRPGGVRRGPWWAAHIVATASGDGTAAHAQTHARRPRPALPGGADGRPLGAALPCLLQVRSEHPLRRSAPSSSPTPGELSACAHLLRREPDDAAFAGTPADPLGRMDPRLPARVGGSSALPARLAAGTVPWRAVVQNTTVWAPSTAPASVSLHSAGHRQVAAGHTGRAADRPEQTNPLPRRMGRCSPLATACRALTRPRRTVTGILGSTGVDRRQPPSTSCGATRTLCRPRPDRRGSDLGLPRRSGRPGCGPQVVGVARRRRTRQALRRRVTPLPGRGGHATGRSFVAGPDAARRSPREPVDVVLSGLRRRDRPPGRPGRAAYRRHRWPWRTGVAHRRRAPIVQGRRRIRHQPGARGLQALHALAGACAGCGRARSVAPHVLAAGGGSLHGMPRSLHEVTLPRRSARPSVGHAAGSSRPAAPRAPGRQRPGVLPSVAWRLCSTSPSTPSGRRPPPAVGWSQSMVREFGRRLHAGPGQPAACLHLRLSLSPSAWPGRTGWPDRPPCDWTRPRSAHFSRSTPGLPAVGLAKRVGHRGTFPAVFNAANEVCVDAFPTARSFPDIVDTVAGSWTGIPRTLVVTR